MKPSALLILSIPFITFLFFWKPMGGKNAALKENLNQINIKTEAYTVLINKCNVCHATKKRTDIFTIENMDSLAFDIHKQVFIKKKMPKGKKVKLTDEEIQSLKNWLDTILNHL